MTITWITQQDPLWESWVSLRDEILRRPLGLQFTAEDLRAEAGELICIALDENHQIFGGLQVKKLDNGEIPAVKIRQVAVRESQQGSGIGKQLMIAAEQRLLRDFPKLLIVLHSRATVTGFYEALGYRVEGTGFLEVGIEHVKMAKKLPSSTPGDAAE